MTWDFAEVNPFSNQSGSFKNSLEYSSKAIQCDRFPTPGVVYQQDASTTTIAKNKMVSSDPPYYDNVPYSDLSDFFYIWLRRSLKGTFPSLLGTMLTPKVEELVADQVRFGSRDDAHRHFEEGMGQVFHRIAEQNHPDYPVTLYYAFKQQEEDGAEENEGSESGWLLVVGKPSSAGW